MVYDGPPCQMVLHIKHVLERNKENPGLRESLMELCSMKKFEDL